MQQTIFKGIPMTLNPSTRILMMNHNNFHSVDASLSFYPQLLHVDLSYNQLVSIPDRSFSNQRRLIELRIESNKISELSDRTLQGLTQLQVLSLEQNFIEYLGRWGSPLSSVLRWTLGDEDPCSSFSLRSPPASFFSRH